MFMLQTLKDFMDNPMGKGSMAIPNRQLITDDLKRRYEKIVAKTPITFEVYNDKNSYYYHFKIPSESERVNSYDVVLQFVEDTEDLSNDNNLKRYFLRFFSNCPSFTFTFAYTFNSFGLLVEDLQNKYKDQVLSDNPIIRNPGEIVSYEKSIFFACYYLQLNINLLDKTIIKPIMKKYNKHDFNKLIRTTDTIEIEIKKEENRLKDIKKKQEIKTSKLGVLDILQRGTVSKRGRTGKINRIKPGAKIEAKKSSIKKIGPI